ncbi:MAG: ABC transporter ATP-binding protein [Pseudomonadota bacterium]
MTGPKHSGLTLEGLTVDLAGRRVLEHIDLTVAPGECVGLIGPNGAGKSTLMRAALGQIPASGHSSLAALPRRQRALAAAWLPQAREIAWGMIVEEIVELGRTPHRRTGAPLRPADRAAIARAMAEADVTQFSTQEAKQLSGGEQARVLLARALAQEAPLLLADEPIAGLDPAHQIAAMEVFAKHAQAGGTVIAALHDLGLAARWCTRLVLLDHGRTVADGPPATVLSRERLATVYGIAAHIADGADGLIVQPLRRHATGPGA